MFRCADPVASAWRLCALLDGLGLQVVLHHGTMTRAQMHKHVRHAAALELAYDLPTDSPELRRAGACQGSESDGPAGR